MNELLSSIETLAEPIADRLPQLIAALVVVVLVVRVGLAYIIRRHQRWRNYREKRNWRPASWTKAEPREHFAIESALLAHKSIREMYTDDRHFTVDLKPKELAWESAWLSPYPRAVRATARAHRGLGRGKKFNGRKQIAELARYVIVRDLPPTQIVVELPPEIDPEETPKQKEKRDRREEREKNARPWVKRWRAKRAAQKFRQRHFRIDLLLDGRSPDEIRRLKDKIVGQLGLHSIQEFETEDNYSLSFAAHKTVPGDPLVLLKKGVDFLKEHAARSLSLIPLAVRESGAVWSLMMHHLLIIGMTGSGKGSPLNGLIRQLAPWVAKGLVKMYGIDPKASELRPYQESSLFEDLAYENADALDVIKEVHKVMKHRAKHKRVDVENANLGRSLDATRENPMVVLFIDEFLSLLIALQAMGKPGKDGVTLLTEILAQGRSLGVYVVAATQEADKDLLGRMRSNFANIALLKQPSPHFNDFFLGEGAREAGYDSTAIPLSTKANGYAYAGIGFVKEETGKPVKVRFAYSSDEDIAELIKQYPKHAGRKSAPAQNELAIGDDDGDTGGFGFEELKLDDDESDGFGRF